MLKKIDGPPEKRAKYEVRCKMKECKKKPRPANDLQALREEVEELREMVEKLAQR